jgi:hypothetical protein
MNKIYKLPEKRERYYTIGGSGKLNDYAAIALFEGQDGKREAVIGIQAPTAEVAASSYLRRAAALASLGLELWG